MIKICADCSADISHRSNATKRCEPCAAKRLHSQYCERNKMVSAERAKKRVKKHPSKKKVQRSRGICERCKAQYEKRGRTSKYCEFCSPIVKKEKNRVFGKRYHDRKKAERPPRLCLRCHKVDLRKVNPLVKYCESCKEKNREDRNRNERERLRKEAAAQAKKLIELNPKRWTWPVLEERMGYKPGELQAFA